MLRIGSPKGLRLKDQVTLRHSHMHLRKERGRREEKAKAALER